MNWNSIRRKLIIVQNYFPTSNSVSFYSMDQHGVAFNIKKLQSYVIGSLGGIEQNYATSKVQNLKKKLRNLEKNLSIFLQACRLEWRFLTEFQSKCSIFWCKTKVFCENSTLRQKLDHNFPKTPLRYGLLFY